MDKSYISYDQSHMQNLLACKLCSIQFLLQGNMKNNIYLRRDLLINLRMLQKPTSQGVPMNWMLTYWQFKLIYYCNFLHFIHHSLKVLA